MNAPWKPRVAAGIAAGILTLSSLVFAPFVVVRAQTPGTPAAGHASATACASMANRMDMGATPYGSPPAMIATPDAGRQTQVAANGGQVMPFDLNRTTHTFTDLPDGGRETVTANDPGDAEQIALVRAHLQAEARKFTAGDFSDPANIHGCDMPGLAQLQEGSPASSFGTPNCRMGPSSPTAAPTRRLSRRSTSGLRRNAAITAVIRRRPEQLRWRSIDKAERLLKQAAALIVAQRMKSSGLERPAIGWRAGRANRHRSDNRGSCQRVLARMACSQRIHRLPIAGRSKSPPLRLGDRPRRFLTIDAVALRWRCQCGSVVAQTPTTKTRSTP